MVFGTDAVAGSHGRNLQELVYRVQKGGQDPMQAIVSATSLSAESLGLGNTIGSLIAYAIGAWGGRFVTASGIERIAIGNILVASTISWKSR